MALQKSWNDAVDSFDAENFAQKANEAGAGFVMVTLGQTDRLLILHPNAAFDSVVGVKPGELCSFRDLPGD